MNKSQRRAGNHHGPTGGPGFLRRLQDLLEAALGQRRLVPVPIATGLEGAYRPQPIPPGELNVHRVFGRRRDEERDRTEAGSDPAPAEEPPVEPPADEESSGRDPLVPQPGPEAAASDQAGDGGAQTAEGAPAEPEGQVADPWSGGGFTDPFSFQPDSGAAPELPAWTPSPMLGGAFPTFEPAPTSEEAGASPWGAGGFGQPEEEAPAPTYQSPGAAGDAWPAAGDQGEQLWAPRAEQEGDESFPAAETTAPMGAEESGQGNYSLPEVEPTSEEGMEMEAPVEAAPDEPGDLQPFEPDQLPEVVAVSETAWEVSPTGAGRESVPEPSGGPEPVVEGARTFPLPEGELLFHNLSVGFTDPARLLRHLAGEGHTGVMHVASQDGRNTYIVLVEGYVVAVASDAQGRLSTSTRVSFPAFPNSQDIITVITYPAEIARGLGLLLHAPVHFSGLGAMFVDLDGLRSFLSKRSASGGLVVEAATGTGVALFDEGRLVGAYSGASIPEEDLAPLRELIKDLDAEIDVRFGGPHSLEPIPLETLLAGYPL